MHMLHHISLDVADVQAAARFYDAALAPGVPHAGFHVAFSAPTRESVDAFHRAALAAGGEDRGRPVARAKRRILGAMAIPHARPGQAIDVRPLGERLAGEKTAALFKSEDLEVMRLVLPAGKSLSPHKVAAEITIQCIEGAIDVTAEGRSHALHAGELMFLAGGVVHGVTALQDASALVTVVLRK